MNSQLSQSPRPFVFVLMPFAPEFVDIYQLGIKACASEVGAYAERVDEQFYQESMLSRIQNQIAKADVIVADMSGRNPNVFYEVGYAHALGKVTLLLTRSADEIPFDLKHWPHIVYGQSISELKRQLVPALQWAITQGENGIMPTWNVGVYVFGDVLLPRAISEAEGMPLRELPTGDDDNPYIRFIIKNKGSARSPTLDACYLWIPVGTELTTTSRKFFHSVLLSAVLDDGAFPWLGPNVTQYKVTAPFLGQAIPPGGFETLTLQVHKTSGFVGRLVFRIVLDGVPQDFFMQY